MATSFASPTSGRRVGLVAAAVAFAWIGFAIHNLADLPDQTLLSLETSVPTLVTLALVLAWWRLPAASWPAWLLLIWALLHLVGGAIVTIIPFPFLPFYPEQTLRHYLFHVIYGVTQLPLIGLMLGQTVNARRGGAG